MRIAETYSHLYAREHVAIHQPSVWEDIERAVASVEVGCHLGDVSARVIGRKLKVAFRQLGWRSLRQESWATSDPRLARKVVELSPDEQKREIEAAGEEAVFSYNQTDFVKERVALEVQFGKYAFVAYDLFVKHLAFYVGDQIDVGIEIMPMKSLQREMSSGVPYYEGEFYNVIRQGRGVPAVPLVLIGIEP